MKILTTKKTKYSISKLASEAYCPTLLKEKQICIVGCSGNIINSKLGKVIDKQKTVVRFRMGLPELYLKQLPKHYLRPLHEDIGTRTDIYANRTSLLKPKVLEVINKNIKCFFTDVNSSTKEFARKREVELYHLDIVGENVREFRERMNYPSGKVSAGLSFILMCLNHKIPEINICGFTTEENYNPKELYEFFQPIDTYKSCSKTNIHNFKKEREFISLLLKEKRIHYLK